MDVCRHAKTCDSKHNIGKSNKGSRQSILFFGKAALPCKEIGVNQTKGKAKIYNNRGKNALPSDGAHEVKIIQNLDLGGLFGVAGNKRVFIFLKTLQNHLKSLPIKKRYKLWLGLLHTDIKILICINGIEICIFDFDFLFRSLWIDPLTVR